MVACRESVSAIRIKPGDRNLLAGGIDGDRTMLCVFELCQDSEFVSGVGRAGDYQILTR
jgi:hypothetical protein